MILEDKKLIFEWRGYTLTKKLNWNKTKVDDYYFPNGEWLSYVNPDSDNCQFSTWVDLLEHMAPSERVHFKNIVTELLLKEKKIIGSYEWKLISVRPRILSDALLIMIKEIRNAT